jgi:hypothetical protein
MYFMEHLGICFILMATGFLLYQEEQRRQTERWVYGFLGVTLFSQGFLGSAFFVMAYWAVFGLR